MTQDEIKEALECCSNQNTGSCKDCPYNDNNEFHCAYGEMCKDALNIINEQEKDIERLKAENDMNMQYIRMMGIQSNIKTSNERVKQAKIEVLKELKDMLRNKPSGWAYTIYIDDMIKELEND